MADTTPPEPMSAVPVAEPSLAELLVLDFLNDPATDLMVLDVQVGINRRGAIGLMRHRNGPDGEYPTYDDNAFGSLVEVESVMHVGPVSVQMLLDFTAAQVAQPGVTVDGVHFAPHDAANVLWGINRATADELRYEVGIAAPTVDALLEGVPYFHLRNVAEVMGMGPASLESLLTHAPVWAETRRMAEEVQDYSGVFDGVSFDRGVAAVALELAHTLTKENYVAAGMAPGPATRLVEGRPYASLMDVATNRGIGPQTMTVLHKLASELSRSL
jgi:DNA uptake protein ComE-like DNA-binding protein